MRHNCGYARITVLNNSDEQLEAIVPGNFKGLYFPYTSNKLFDPLPPEFW